MAMKQKAATQSIDTSDLGILYTDKGRSYFTDDRAILEVPGLIDIQIDSYRDFLSMYLEKAFNEVFPVVDFSGEKVEIHFKGYHVEDPKYTIGECRRKNLNFESSLKVRLEMLNKLTGEIKEQDVYMGGIPLMTDKGTFIINGVERVVVNQIIRSTGMFFVPDAKTPGSFGMKVVPQKGCWLEIETEKKGAVFVKIDKKRKIPISTLLRAYGLGNDSDILAAFSEDADIVAKHIGPTIEKDKTKNKIEALHAIYKLLRPGDLGTDERVQDLFNTTFFDPKKFELGPVARMKINRKLNRDNRYEEQDKFLQLEDLIGGIQYLLRLKERYEGYTWDDIDHLENRRVKSVGEMVYERVRVGLARMEKIAKDRMTIVELDDATPGTFINSRPFTAVLKEFFASSQMSQFMDQSNPVSEIAQKRRVSAL